MKTCTKCGVSKPEEQYYAGHAYCCECHIQQMKLRYYADIERSRKYSREYARRWRAEHKDRVHELEKHRSAIRAAARVCPDCGIIGKMKKNKHRCPTCRKKSSDLSRKRMVERSRDIQRKRRDQWTTEEKARESARKKAWYEKNKKRVLAAQKKYRDGRK